MIRFQIENAGIIKEANIEIDGLTIIAGENDTGKSFVGKLLFAVVKGLNKYGYELIKEKGNSSLSIVKNRIDRAINSEFYYEIRPKYKSKPTIVKYGDTKDDVVTLSFKNPDKDTKKCTIDISFKDSIFNRAYITDATLIESPIILQLYNMISVSDTIFDAEEYRERVKRGISKGTVPLHIKDLIDKLRMASDLINIPKNGKEKFFESDKIRKLMGGYVKYDSGKNDFVFRKKISGKEADIRILNTATGIKSMGIIQMLLDGDLLDSHSILIIDEPEVHLHPKWQVEYARLIVDLVEYGVPVLISSHSPFMIQALKRVSEKRGLVDKTNFYLAEKEDDFSAVIKDVSDDPNQIFVKLAEPLDDIFWE